MHNMPKKIGPGPKKSPTKVWKILPKILSLQYIKTKILQAQNPSPNNEKARQDLDSNGQKQHKKHKQTSRQTNKPTDTPTSKWATRQTSRQSNGQVDISQPQHKANEAALGDCSKGSLKENKTVSLTGYLETTYTSCINYHLRDNII